MNKNKKVKCMLVAAMSFAMVGCVAFGTHAAFTPTRAEDAAVVAPVSATKQWDIEAPGGATTAALDNGNYKLTTPGPAGTVTRVATSSKYDFGSFEMSVDMTNAPDTTGGNMELCLGFMPQQNGWFYECADGSYFMIALRKTSATTLTVCLFNGWGTFASNTTYGQADLDLTTSKIVHIKIEKTEEKVIFNFNDQKIEYAVSKFYGDTREIFTDEAFDGSRYLILGSMGAYEVEISPFKDKSFTTGADVVIAAVEAYEEAAQALTNTSTQAEVNAAIALKSAINLDNEALSDEQKADLTARVAAADALIETQRARLVVEGAIASVDAYVDAANALNDTCTQADVDAADALKTAINLAHPEVSDEVRAAQQTRITDADALVEVQRLRLAAEAGGNPVVGDTTMTPWSYHIAGTDAKLLNDGSVRLTVPHGGFGTRAAYNDLVDFGTFQVTMDFSQVQTGTFPDWLLFMFVNGYNKYMSEDSGALTIAFERHKQAGENDMRILLYKSTLPNALTDPSGKAYEKSFVLPANQILNFRIEKTDTAVIFHMNDDTLEVPVSYFYGDERKVFDAEGDEFDGKRYLTVGTQSAAGTPMVITMSPFGDSETTAYNQSIESTVKAVNDYIAAATALSNECTVAQFLAVEEKAEGIDLNAEGIRAYTKNFLGRRMTAANVIMARHRARLGTELVSQYVQNFEAAVAKITDKATLAAAEASFVKINMDAVNGLPDETEKNAYLERINTAKTQMQTKTDALVNDMIAALEEKTASLDSTTKLIAAVDASLSIDSELFSKVSAANAEAYGARLVAARGKIEKAKEFNKYQLANSMYATTTAEGTMGVYVTPKSAGDSPVIFLKDQVSALNVNIELNIKQQASGFFAIQLMQKMESFYNAPGTEVAGNRGVVLRINKASTASRSYDVAVYVIRATSANGFEGCLYNRFTAPVSEDGKLSVVFLQDGNYVDLIINGTKMIANRIQKTVMQGIYGAEFKGYLSVMSTIADEAGDAVHEYEISKINGKSVFADNVAEPVVIPATSVTLNKTTAELKQYDSLLLTATVKPDDTTDNSVTWSSSNEDIVVVDETGYVTAVAVGEATITVTTSNGLTATCTIKVVDENGNGGGTDKPSGGKKGCGSVVGGVAISSVTAALAGLALVFKKKRK